LLKELISNQSKAKIGDFLEAKLLGKYVDHTRMQESITHKKTGKPWQIRENSRKKKLKREKRRKEDLKIKKEQQRMDKRSKG
jgi:hypothetical protein